MHPEFAIASLIETRQSQLHIKSADLVRRLGFKNVSKGLRRLDALRHGDLSATTRFIIDRLPAALDLSPEQVTSAVTATADQIAEAERARAEAEEQAYRSTFRPHVLWVTERSRPSSITMAIFYGIERLLRLNLDAEKDEQTFVAQAKAAMPSSVPFFGNVVGFYVNFSPDRCEEYDRDAKALATLPKAQRLPEGDVTLKDGRSILPLLGVAPPRPED